MSSRKEGDDDGDKDVVVVLVAFIIIVITSFSTSSPNRNDDDENVVSFIGVFYVQKNLNAEYSFACVVFLSSGAGLCLSHIVSVRSLFIVISLSFDISTNKQNTPNDDDELIITQRPINKATKGRLKILKKLKHTRQTNNTLLVLSQTTDVHAMNI